MGKQMELGFVLNGKIITPEQARQILSTENYVGQRLIRKHHVSYLANEIIMRRFAPGTKIHFAICEGAKYLINGQHTLSAIDKSQIPVALTIQETVCANMDQVAHLFATEDRQLQRSVSDVYHAYNFADKIGVKTHHAGNLCAALSFLRTNVCGLNINQKPSPEDLMADATPLAESYVTFLDAIHGHNSTVRKMIERQPIIAAALITIDHTKGYDFWNGMAMDDGLQKGDPRKYYLNYLRDVKEDKKRMDRAKEHKVTTPLYAFKFALYCFEKFASGRLMHNRTHEAVMSLEAVKGTAFDKGFNAAAYRRLVQ